MECEAVVIGNLHEGEEISKIFAVLLYSQGSYTYVDKLSQASSKDLALFYVREALRDYNSLLNSGKIDEDAQYLSNSINFSKAEEEINQLKSKSNTPDLREMVSYISSQALVKAAGLKSRAAYNLGRSVVNWLKSKGKFREDLSALSSEISSNAAEISKDLHVDIKEIETISDNRNLLQYLVKQSKETAGSQGV
jgi:CRISPR-associated protein Csa5